MLHDWVYDNRAIHLSDLTDLEIRDCEVSGLRIVDCYGSDVHVAPGVAAVQAVAARAGAPIGADFAVVSLSDRLKPWDVIDQRLDAIAAADLVLAVYNPASRSRTHQVSDAREVILRHRCPTTPVIVCRDVGRTEESLTVTTLADLDCDSVDMKCLLIVGASGTRITDSGRVWSPRFVRA